MISPIVVNSSWLHRVLFMHGKMGSYVSHDSTYSKLSVLRVESDERWQVTPAGKTTICCVRMCAFCEDERELMDPIERMCECCIHAHMLFSELLQLRLVSGTFSLSLLDYAYVAALQDVCDRSSEK